MQPFALEQEYRDHLAPCTFDLSSSSPAPLSVRDVLPRDDAAALLDAPLQYVRGGGPHELRAAVAASQYNFLAADDILITAGAAEAIHAVSMALITAGDIVAVQHPSYGALSATPARLGVRVLPWRATNGFDFDSTPLNDADLRDASVVFVNTPHGPSGSVMRGDLGGRRFVADEVYRPIELVPGTRSAALADRDERAVSIGDLSKPLGLGGLRIGWIATRDRALLQRCAVALDYLSGSVSALSAAVALAALRNFDALLTPHLIRARGNLTLLATFVEQHSAWVDWTPPQAGYTAFLRLRGNATGATISARMRARGIFLLDGAVYGCPHHVRVGFGLESQQFSEALAIFGDELRRLPATSPSKLSSDVIVIAKDARPGYTKTRLAAGVGAQEAAALSAAFLDDTLELARTQARRIFIAYAPDDARAAFARLAPEATLVPQPPGDLGTRLSAAFEQAFAAGAQSPVLIGSDSPTMPAHLLGTATRLLETHDVVLGPAEDGGYYLIGMTRHQPALFDDIEWGGSDVLAGTLDRARNADLRVATLPYWYDVDSAADLARLARDPLLGRATRAQLAQAPVGAMAGAAGL